MAQRVHNIAGTGAAVEYVCRKGPPGDMEASVYGSPFRKDAPQGDRAGLVRKLPIGCLMADEYIIRTDPGTSLFDVSVDRIAYGDRHGQRKRSLCLFLDDGDAPLAPVYVRELQVDDITCPEPHPDARHYHGDPSERYRAVSTFPVLLDLFALVFREDIDHFFPGSTSGVNAQMEMLVLYLAGIFQKDDKSPYDSEAGRLSIESLVPVLKAELLEGIRVYAPESGIIMVCQIPA